MDVKMELRINWSQIQRRLLVRRIPGRLLRRFYPGPGIPPLPFLTRGSLKLEAKVELLKANGGFIDFLDVPCRLFGLPVPAAQLTIQLNCPNSESHAIVPPPVSACFTDRRPNFRSFSSHRPSDTPTASRIVFTFAREDLQSHLIMLGD